MQNFTHTHTFTNTAVAWMEQKQNDWCDDHFGVKNKWGEGASGGGGVTFNISQLLKYVLHKLPANEYVLVTGTRMIPKIPLCFLCNRNCRFLFLNSSDGLTN